MKLLLIESPGKVETLKKYLSNEYEVIATKGHIRDLPEKTLGVNVAADFDPTYEVIPDKKTLASTLVSKSKKADEIYLASDPDREGEAIAWHLCSILGIDPEKSKRVTFNALTKESILEGIQNPRPVDMNLVDAQQARRILDRLIGYKLSPLISRKIRNKLSAGRVQSVALKIVVDREKKIKAFVPVEYWEIDAILEKSNKKQLKTSFFAHNNKKLVPDNEGTVNEIMTNIADKPFVVSNIKKSVTTANAPAPYITSTLQQDAVNRLRMTLKSFTSGAQNLYEGVEIGGEGKVALVTYIRTDSTRIATSAQDMAKEYILEKYGNQYIPTLPNVFKSKKSAQDAHEAIRPVSLKYTPEFLKGKIDSSLYKLYCMIFNRFLASQMMPAKYNSLAIEFTVSEYQFKTTGRTLLFDGFTKVYDIDDEKESAPTIPSVEEGETLRGVSITPTQKFTKPPARYTEASLVKELDEKGIGRPATFAATVMTLYNRTYMEKDGKSIVPSELGIQVTDYLEKYFVEIMNIEYTAEMEEKLDEIEFGGKRWQDSIKDFYVGFEKELDRAYELGEKVKKPAEMTDIDCEKCGNKMVIREGRFGKFMACSNFPKCKNTRNIEGATDDSLTKLTGLCPKCGKIVSAKKSKKGKIFYGCDGYPDCDFMSWDLPLAEKCEECGEIMYAKVYKESISSKYCPNKDCKNAKSN